LSPSDVINMIEGNYDNIEEIKPYNTEEEFAPNVANICIKHGTAAELSKLLARQGAIYYAADINSLYMGYNNKWRKLSVGGSSGDGEDILPDPSSGGDGEDNENNDFMTPVKQITFIAEPEIGQAEGKEYVMTLNSKGNFVVRDKSIVDAKPQELNENYTTGVYLWGLFFSNIYAGGYTINSLDQKVSKNDTPCSHNFIELYNNTDSAINLEGTSIQYSEGGSTAKDWKVLPLKGTVPSRHSFLIRGAKLTDNALVQIEDYDIDFPDLIMSDEKFKLYLTSKITPCTVSNPTNITATGSNFNNLVFDNGYIDFFSCINGASQVTIDAIEGGVYSTLTNKSCMVRKYIADPVQGLAKIKTFNTSKDFMEIRYDIDLDTLPSVEIYKPWAVNKGIKTLYYDKSKMIQNGISTISMTYGLIPSTRCFSWTSRGYNNEYIYYRKIKDKNGTDLNNVWIKLESIKALGEVDLSKNYLEPLYKRILVDGADGIKYTVHKQIIRNLSEGEYEYYVGCNKYISSVYKFTIRIPGQNDAFDFVQISDEQGWNRMEYEPHRMAMDFIKDAEMNKNSKFPATGTGKFDFLVNTGDITQNGIRPGEWLSYYELCQDILAEVPCMTVVGNNDLCPTPGQTTGKNFPLSFEYFNTYEHNPENMPWEDKDDISKGTMKSVYSYDYGCVHFSCLNSNNYLDNQIPWLKKDIELAKNREIKPKYYIVIVHDGPFNIVSQGATERNNKSNDSGNPDITKRYLWSRLFEELEIDIVMCGHKHTYSFSNYVRERVTTVKVNTTTGQIDENAPEGSYKEVEIVNSSDAVNPKVIKLSDVLNDRENILNSNTDFNKYVIYTMSQATGYKLSSNVDIPATNISWLASYYPGIDKSGKMSANPEQFYPSYIRYNILEGDKGIEIVPYKLTNIMVSNTQTFLPYATRTEPVGRADTFAIEGSANNYFTMLPKIR
ncbi:MAG: metallophosphoesterase, partial [Clostridia bacterium]